METGPLTKKDAINFLNEATQGGILVSGVERLLVEDDGHMPDLNGILDLSSFVSTDPSRAISEAATFINGFSGKELQKFTISYRK